MTNLSLTTFLLTKSPAQGPGIQHPEVPFPGPPPSILMALYGLYMAFWAFIIPYTAFWGLIAPL